MSTELVPTPTQDGHVGRSSSPAAGVGRAVGPHRYVEPEYHGPAMAEGEHGHPSDWQYVYVALGLGALTAIEIAISELSQNNATRSLLIALGAIKFAVVAAFFMHLKFDSKVLRYFLVGGILLAIPLYIVVIAAMGNLV